VTRRPETPKLKYVKFTRAKGKLYAYFNTGRKVNGKPVLLALPQFGTVGFYDSYTAALGARTKRRTVVATVAGLIESYEASDAFRLLSPGTQKVYGIYLKKIGDAFGKLPIETITRKHVRHVLGSMEGAASRNMFVAVVGALYKWGRGHDMTERNPVVGIEKYKTGEHAPWPKALLEDALSAEDDAVRLAVHLLFYSGQRLGDVAKLPWSAVRAGRLSLRQQKTGKDVSIPLHSALSAELDRTPKRGVFILCHPNGRPISAEAIRARLKTFAAARNHLVVPHGLRKNAVNALLEAGCTIAEVQSITGQTMEIVAHYAKGVDRDKLADAAILKFEGRNKK